MELRRRILRPVPRYPRSRSGDTHLKKKPPNATMESFIARDTVLGKGFHFQYESAPELLQGPYLALRGGFFSCSNILQVPCSIR